MRKGRQSRAAHLGPFKGDAPETFFRLCHHCLFLNESEIEIQQCHKCERKFIMSGEEEFVEMSDEELFEEQMEAAPPRKKTCLAGLNVKW